MELQPDDSKVLFDGGSHPLPVALRHLRLGSAGYNGRAEQQTVEPSRRTDGGPSFPKCLSKIGLAHSFFILPGDIGDF